MTFGEKLKNARKESGLSQEKLAEKLMVSRSAVAKWESDKGMPDIDNIKAIAKLLGVSIDHLLSEEDELSLDTIKEAINLDDYTKTGKCRSKHDAAVLAKFPDAVEIIPLIRKKKLSKIEKIHECTVMPAFGLFETVDQINNPDLWYLVKRAGREYLVQVSKEFIITSLLSKSFDKNTMVIGSNKFTKVKYKITD